MITFELMVPFDNRFSIPYPQISYVIVNQITMIVFIPHPTDQFGLSEVCYLPTSYLRINSGTPLIVGLQVNEPYF